MSKFSSCDHVLSCIAVHQCVLLSSDRVLCIVDETVMSEHSSESVLESLTDFCYGEEQNKTRIRYGKLARLHIKSNIQEQRIRLKKIIHAR